ncbi:MAG: hypothetical protein IJC81_02150 [Clostridia bacterium]|nr:hypothetical protein [Clostridia bacterium]
MKKLLIMLVISALLVLSAFAAETTVYVNDGGNGDGLSASTPVGTLADAYAALGEEGGKVVITDTLSLTESFTEPTHSGKVIITGGTLSVKDIRFILNGATTFENITLKGNNYLSIFAQYNPIVFGEGITVSGFGNFTSVTKGITIVGGVRDEVGNYADTALISKDTNITMKSGKAIIIGFNRDMTDTFTGTAHINLEGGTYYNIYMGSIGAGKGGNIDMNISGGTFTYNIYSNAKTSKVAGNINVTITGGDFSASTFERFDCSVTTDGAKSTVDVSALEDSSVIEGKLEGVTELVKKEENPPVVNFDTVYINDGGSGDGAIASAPVGTLDDAYAALGEDGGTVVITEKLTLTGSFTEPTHSGKVTITGGTLEVPNMRFILNGATKFENITLHGNEKYLLLVAQFNPIVFGEGITVTGFGDFTEVAQAITIVGGVQSGADKYKDESLIDKDTSITVKSGKALIIAGSRGVSTDYKGTTNITIEGGTFYNIYLGSNSGTFKNANLTISGGTFIYNVYSSAKISNITDSVTAKITGGDFSAVTLTRFDGSVTSESGTSVVDVRGLADYSTLVGKMEGYKKIITPEGEIFPEEKTAIQDAFLYGSFTASDGTVIPYRYYLPEGYETSGKDYPIFIYMHGNGSRGTNNTSQLSSYSIQNAVYESDYECIMIAPQCPSSPYEWTLYGTVGKVNHYPGSEKYAEFLESGEPYGSKYFCAAVELFDMFITDYRVDTSRVYLGGSSNGTGAVWNLLTLYPEVFAAAVPVSGARATDDYAHAIAHRMKDIPIWAFHGDLDTSESGSPVEGTRSIVKALREVDAKITYTEVVGGNHSNIWKIAADTPGIVDWLFSQTNESFENTLSGEKGEALPAPENLKWNADIATWDGVENAGAYRVTIYVDGVLAKSLFTINNYYTPDFSSLSEGEVTFAVRAHPSNNAYSISAESAKSKVYLTDVNIDDVADYDGNGTVDLKDAMILLKAIVNNSAINGDLSGDRKTTLLDVLRLIKHIAK